MNALLLQPVAVDKPFKSLEAEPKSHTLFRNFVGELDSLYARTNDVMSGVEFKQWPPEQFGWALSWNETRTALEGANATVLPFTIEQITRTMSVLLLSDKTGIHYTGEIEDPDNTAAISYNLQHTLPSGGSASLTIYNALRRYVEAERVAFVWRVLAEGQGEFEDLYANEHAWLTLRSSTDKAGRPTTTIEGCAQLQILGLDGPVEGGDARGDRFVELLAHADAEDMKEVRQAMQRMLLDNETDDEADVLELKL